MKKIKQKDIDKNMKKKEELENNNTPIEEEKIDFLKYIALQVVLGTIALSSSSIRYDRTYCNDGYHVYDKSRYNKHLSSSDCIFSIYLHQKRVSKKSTYTSMEYLYIYTYFWIVF